MAKTIRMLPALMAVSVGALGFKAVAIAEAATEAVASEPPDEAYAGKDGDHSGDSHGDEHASEGHDDAYFSDYGVADESHGEDSATQCVAATPDFSAETGLSQYEIEVLRSLADRRAELDERASELDTREKVATAAEKRLEDQIAELKTLEAGVQDLLEAMEAKRDERLAGLVKVYESMKPKDAARIFDALDNTVLLQVSQRMKSASLAAVMSKMSSVRAEELTRLLAERAELPETAQELLSEGARAG